MAAMRMSFRKIYRYIQIDADYGKIRFVQDKKLAKCSRLWSRRNDAGCPEGRSALRTDAEPDGCKSRKNVVVISSDFAEMVYLRKNIVGKKLRIFIGTESEDFEIIGVVSAQKDGISQLLGDSLPQFSTCRILL